MKNGGNTKDKMGNGGTKGSVTRLRSKEMGNRGAGRLTASRLEDKSQQRANRSDDLFVPASLYRCSCSLVLC